ncbi:MAG: flippase-like domain-containing protein [Chloroflexi bacterium]|nr:flippase-like domain-containing protein [Chloroflexota bacterium]
MLKRRLFTVAKYGVSLGLLALIIVRADISGFATTIKDVNVLLFMVAMLIRAMNMLVRSYKWQILLSVHGSTLSLSRIQSINYMSLFFNNFFLGSIGGDAFRIYSTIKYSNTKGGAASAVIMERATGLFMALAVVLVLGTAFLLSAQDLITANLIIALSLLGVLGISVILAWLKYSAGISGLTFLKRIPRARALSEDLATSMRAYRNHRRIVLTSLGLSLLYHIVNSFVVYFVALAANANVSVLDVMLITPLVAMLIMIPISVNGIGIQEGSYVFYLEQVGVAGPAALLTAVLARLGLFIFSLIGGLLLLLQFIGRHRKPAGARLEGLPGNRSTTAEGG